MCGIAGIVNLDGAPVEPGALQAMSARLTHRGPDESQIWSEDNAGLAHTRLSIIDLGGSHQPMSSHDERKILAFNGEILNYQSLRDDMDYPFKTSGDTETILAAHVVDGEDAPSRFAGQFAYALWDRDQRQLLLARDRIGILPLYWYKDTKRFVFASEMSALLAGLDHTPALDLDALSQYLAARYVAAPSTLLAGVHKLEPGTTLRLEASRGLALRRYWAPDWTTRSRLAPGQVIEELDQLLTTSVQRALIADTPVGAYLSGGVDSSLIVAKAAQLGTHGGLNTYCAEFGDARFDETMHANTVSELFSTRHHTVPVRPDDFQRTWSLLSEHRGAPLGEPADVAVYKLAQAAHADVKVVLSGEGSDELFGGYPKYRYAQLTARAGMVPARVRSVSARELLRLLPPKHRRLGVALRALSERSFDDRLRTWFAPFTTTERERLGAGQPLAPLPDNRSLSPLKRMLAYDVGVWLPDNLLERADRMSMTCSLEVRPPFLDNNIVAFATSLPDAHLVRNGVGKWAVKEVARRHLPPAIIDRPKVGFRVPLDSWFRSGLRDFARDAVDATDSVTRSHLSSRAVHDMFDQHDGGRHDHAVRIWTLASLEVWYSALRAKL